jgi:carbon-monoxide dehydrogenase medium subunit
VPKPAAGSVYVYHSFGHLERPAVSVAVGLVPADGVPRYSIFAGALTSAPVRLAALENALVGVSPERLGEVVAKKAEQAVSDLETDDDLLGSADYKRHLAGVLLGRACKDIAAGVREALT